MELKKGTNLQGGKYKIEKKLGQGSFGITYLATAKFTTESGLGKMDVVAKVCIKEFFMSDVNSRKEDGSTIEGSTGSVFTNYRRKFRKEAENLAKLSHSNIVRVFDVFDENGTSYYVMEFLDGENLDDYIKTKGRLPEDEAIKIIKEVGAALSYMHSKKMLHLDMKPKNVMHRNDATNHLIDFGLSKQYTENGEPESSTSIGLGTPGYAPLEQSQYKQDGSFPATLDVYALAATLFKMLSGERPPEATYILNDGFPVEKLQIEGISEHTCAALEKGMSPMRKQRYQTIKAFLEGIANPEIEEVTVVEKPVIPKPKPATKSKPTTKTEPQNSKSEVISSEPRRYLGLKLSEWLFTLCALAIIGGIYLWKERPWEEPTNPTSVLTEQTTLDTVNQKIPETVTNMQWDSPLGRATYTGSVQPDSFINSNKLIPHGKGVAKITAGKYKGSIYDGELYWGKFEGKARYTRSDGDIFEGTFKNNQYSNGTYTSKETGDYFNGTFKNEQPYKGNWYDKNGKKY